MLRAVVFVFAAAIAATIALAAATAQDIVIPAYAPQLGKEITWLSVTEMVVESRGASQIPRTKGYGAFTKRMSVIARDKDTMTATWRFDAERPDGSALPEGNYFLNEHFRHTLELWRVEQLTVETDTGGHPLRVLDLPRLRAEMQDKIEHMLQGATVQDGTVLAQVMAQLDAAPLFLAEALIPEASLVARAQRNSPVSSKVGVTGATEDNSHIVGRDLLERTRWTLEAIDTDKRTLTIGWEGEHDPAALAQAQESAIAKEIEAVRSKDGAVSDQRIADLRRVFRTRSGRAVISMRDGATIEAQETTDNLLAGLRITQTMRVSRVAP
jgi:hypothetical protein